MSRARGCAVVLAGALAAAPAATAEPLVHLDAGLDLAGAHGVTSIGFRGRALVGTTFGSGSLRPALAAGGTLGAGRLSVADPRAVDGAVALSLTSYGPELQLGLQRYADGEPTTRVFASLAYLHVALDSRLAIDPIGHVGGDRGERAAIGVKFARAELAQPCDTRQRCAGLLLLMLPQQLELAAERDGGSTRYGVTLSWGS